MVRLGWWKEGGGGMLGPNQDKSKLRIKKLMTERDRNLPKRFRTSLFFIIHVRTKAKERNKKFEEGTVSKVTDTECAVRMSCFVLGNSRNGHC